MVIEMEDKSQIKFLIPGFRDFARNDNASTTWLLIFLNLRESKK